MADIIRVLRVIEYTGPRAAVEEQVARSLHGEKKLNNGVVIRAATVGGYPEVLENLEEIEVWPGSPQCLSTHSNQRCMKVAGHAGPHQEGKEVWNHA